MAASSRSLSQQHKGTEPSHKLLPSLSKTGPKEQSSRDKPPSVAVDATIASESTAKVVAAQTTSTSKKKKKRHSPFRIKVGCLVALRYRAQGNHLKRAGIAQEEDGPYAQVWTDPQPQRDEGLALIGKRVRCCFSKSVLSNNEKPALTRILEGEVISLPDYDIQWQAQRQAHRRREPCCTSVELLVHRKALTQLPFLQRTDEDVDTSNMTAIEKKRQKFEEVIRGKDMVTVKVNLADVSGISTRDGGEDYNNELVVKRWVVRKRVPTSRRQKPNDENGETSADKSHQKNTDRGRENGSDVARPCKKRKRNNHKIISTTLFVGDGNDPQSEQESNWRWLAGRYDGMMLSSVGATTQIRDQLSCGFIGEVLKVEPAPSSFLANGVPHTLAMVTLRRMILPEHTISGRLFHHGPVEIFDDADVYGLETELGAFQVPVEELVIVSRKFQRKLDTTTNDLGSTLSCPIITQSYSYRSNSFSMLTSPAAYNSEATFASSYQFNNGAKGKRSCHKYQVDVNKLPDPIAGAKCVCNTWSTEVQETLFTHQIRDAFATELQEKNVSSRDKDSVSPAVSNACAVCGIVCTNSCESCCLPMHSECAKWNMELDRVPALNGSTSILCRLCRCHHRKSQPLDDASFVNVADVSLARYAASIMGPVNFDLPRGIMDFELLPEPSEKLIKATGTKRKRRKRLEEKPIIPVRGATGKTRTKPVKGTTGKKTCTEAGTSPRRLVSKVEQVEYASVRPFESYIEEEVFVPSSSRLTPYDPVGKRLGGPSNRLMQMDTESSLNEDAWRNLPTEDVGRACRRRPKESERVAESKTTSRADRANQRRLKKGVAALGAFGLQLDSLADREQKLRFDRSSIHAWGVFADEDIGAGDMVVEYRGELIGNAVAEKREAEYQEAKIGSDYMFRIDGLLVCDATKQGNVARFINASCDPNCYTQIITLNGNKRIVIYAKRDIKAGEELCYDYKFPFEFDEAKRIKCNCGARDCRGFMNWDKRFVGKRSLQGNTTSHHKNA